MHATSLLVILLSMAFCGCVRHSRRPDPAAVAADRAVDCYESLQELLAIPAIGSTEPSPVSHNTLSNREDALRIPTARDFAGDSPNYWLHVNKEAGIAFVTMTGGIGGNLNATYGPWPIDEPKVNQLVECIATSADP